MLIKDYLKDNVVVIDGAMGTYYTEKTNEENSASDSQIIPI